MLNEGLYHALEGVFGDVKIAKEGESLVARACTRAVPLPNQRKNYIHIENSGETYRVNCPFCGDTRNRLHINHRWNDSIAGMPLENESYMAQCFNEECQRNVGFKKELKELIKLGKSLPVIQKGRVVVKPEKFDWPGTVIPLTELDPQHAIVEYLEGRGFSVKELSDDWGFRWIQESDSNLIWDNNRLIVPIYGYLDGNLEMLGWQTRYFDYEKKNPVPPSKKIPKYLTQGKKNRLLFNGYRVRGNSPVVLTEGTLDAIKFGKDHGVCAFGKAISNRQKELLWNSFGKHGADIVLALDPDVEEEAVKKLVDSFNDWSGKVVVLKFPEGYDAADFTTEQLWALVEAYGIKKRKLV